MRDEIRRIVTRINEAWRAERFAELEAFFHPDVVAASPHFDQRTFGREALIVSYAQFAASARIDEFTTGETQVDLVGVTAIATTPWRMKYEFENALYDESGWDLMVFAAQMGGWVVVWRTVLING